MNRRNKYIIQQIDEPVAKISSVNVPSSAKQEDGDNCRQLANILFISVNCKIILLWNINTKFGLVNGAIGIIRDICYRHGNQPPSLP